MNRFSILMYHRVASDRCPVSGPEETRYAVELASFEWQLDRIRASGRVGVSMKDVHDCLAAGKTVPAEWVGLTFDDGNRSDVVHALPLLRDRGFRATFYVTTQNLGTDAGLDEGSVRALVAAGMHIGSHAVTHRFLTSLSAEDELEELRHSKDKLEALTGAPVDHFAPPGGRFSERTMAALDTAGYVAIATSQFGFNQRDGARSVYRRIPIMASTTRRQFTAAVVCSHWPLLGVKMRSRALLALRRLLGEKRYRRIRSLAAGK